MCGTRRKNKSYDILNLKNNNLRKMIPGDDIYQFYGNYKVVDINIWSNKTIDDIKTSELDSILPFSKTLPSYLKYKNNDIVD